MVSLWQFEFGGGGLTSRSSRAAASQVKQPGFSSARVSEPAGGCLANPLCPGPEGQGSPFKPRWGAFPAPLLPPLLHHLAADALCLRPSLPAASIEAPWLRLGRVAVGWPRPTRCGTESSPPFLRTSTVKVRGGARVVAVTWGGRGVLEDWDAGGRDSGNLLPAG